MKDSHAATDQESPTIGNVTPWNSFDGDRCNRVTISGEIRAHAGERPHAVITAVARSSGPVGREVTEARY